jgi:hypothetical protein
VNYLDISTVSSLISSVGFPMFVAIYMLFKNTEDTKKTNEVLTELKVAIEKLCHKEGV